LVLMFLFRSPGFESVVGDLLSWLSDLIVFLNITQRLIENYQLLLTQPVMFIHILSNIRISSLRVPGYRSRGPGSIPGTTRFSE
jgi:hypothetical protein